MVKAFDGSISEDEILRQAASLEASSEHPLAGAIVQGAKDKNLSLSPVENFESMTGHGISGSINSKKVFIGNLNLIKARGMDPGAVNAVEMEDRQSKGETVMVVVINDQLAGYISV